MVDNKDNAPISKAFGGDRDTTIITKKKVGLKINNQGSVLETLPKQPDVEEFQQRATVANNNLNAHAVKATELALRWKKILLDDKTLAANKSIFALDIERELLTELGKLASDISKDPHEEESGELGLVALLLRSMLLQRDRINQLEWTTVVLRQDLTALEKKVKEMNLLSLDNTPIKT